MTSLPYPPIAPQFLALFPGRADAVIWENPSMGIFGVLVPGPGYNERGFPIPESPPQAARVRTSVVEVPSTMVIPSIPTEQQCRDPPVCMHGKPALRRTVMRKDSPNVGRHFYVCTSTVGESGGNCGFFRWSDELDQYSSVRMHTPLTAEDVKRETIGVEARDQLDAWSGVQQGSERWHRLRACRITASNFGSAHRTNTFCTPADLLRNILWPSSMDSVAMRYGSVNEKTALWRFSEWLSENAEHPELPIYIDEPGIWLCAQYPFLAGSPDGVVYETVEARKLDNEGGMYYRCRRSLLEIKTPWKLRNRQEGGDFYPLCHQKNGRHNHIPCSYYDQIQGNAWLMGLSFVYFVVLAPSGYQVTVEPYDPVYVTQSLLPALIDFWTHQVVPAFEERDQMGKEKVPIGWIPACARRRKQPTDSSDS